MFTLPSPKTALLMVKIHVTAAKVFVNSSWGLLPLLLLLLLAIVGVNVVLFIAVVIAVAQLGACSSEATAKATAQHLQ